MRKTLVAALTLFALVACKKEQPQTPAPETPIEAAAPAPRKDEPSESGSGDSDAPQQVVLTAPMVKRFLGYWEKSMTHRAELMKQAMKNAKDHDEDNVVDAVAHLKKNAALMESDDEKEKALLKEFDLTREQADRLQELTLLVSVQRQTATQGDFAAGLGDMEKQLSSLPPEQQAEARAQFHELKAQLDDLQSLKEVRAAFGDEATDAAVKHEKEIAALAQKQIELFRVQ